MLCTIVGLMAAVALHLLIGYALYRVIVRSVLSLADEDERGGGDQHGP